jgi:DeoR family fructose operon transcriptional repressor
MFAEERQSKIYEIIYQQQTVKVTELSRLLDISEATIRRDLDEMQLQNKIIRTHGGAMLAYSVGRPINSAELMAKDVELKHRIASVAYEHIKDHDTLLLDSSSTVYELARMIASEQRANLRIITTSLLVVQALSNCKTYKVMIIGGELIIRIIQSRDMLLPMRSSRFESIRVLWVLMG